MSETQRETEFASEKYLATNACLYFCETFVLQHNVLVLLLCKF